MSASSSKTSRSKTPTNNTLSRFDRGPDDLLRHFASSTSSLTISPEFLFLVLLELLVLYLTDNDPVKSRLLFQLEVAFLQTSGILSKSDTLPLLSIRESPHFQKYVRVLRDSIERALQVVQQPPSVSGSQSIATILEKEYAKMILTTPLPSNITIDIPQPDLQLRVPIPFSMNGNVTTNDFENVVVFRYIQDFYELDKLGKGAFGSVFRASNHLDNRMYAIKKIVFNENTDRTRREAQRALREVRVLASLSHPNIVQYHCAWLELVPVEMRHHQPKSSQVKSRSLAQVKPDDSLDDLIQFEAQSSSHAVNPKGTKDETRPKSSTTSTSPDDDDGDDESEVSAMGTNGELSNLQNHHQCHSDGDHLSLSSSKITLHHSTSCHESGSKEKVTSKALMPVSFRNAQLQLRTASSSSSKGPYVTSKIVLFIQMQLCDTTLHEWLRHRDQAIVEELSETSCQLNESGQKECWNIFKQLLTAIEYLHSQSFVHRDIKPRNIFLSYDSKDPSSVHVKLGDFGLATLLDVESTPNSPTQIVNSESGGVGTALYAAPEQLNSRRCLATAKCDSYSLGIVLFELFNIFSTEMERYSCLSDLRVNTKIDQYFAELYPFEANLIEQLVSVDRERRPDVDQILAMCTAQINQRIKKQQHGSKQKMIEQLKETLRDRDRRIRELELELDRRK